MPAPVDLVGHACVFSLLTRFAEVDELDALAFRKGLVEFVESVDPDGFAPVVVLLPGGFNLCHNISFKYFPVTESGSSATSSGVPHATMRPPLAPPSGPMSIR